MVHTTTSKVFSFPHSRFIGFGQVWNEIEKLSSIANEKGFPRHNVIKHSDTKLTIELALAGYKGENIHIESRPGLLIVTGDSGIDESEYLYKGITTKKFTETFRLAEHVVVDGADFVNGLLVIDLRVELPEAQRPRSIQIRNVSGGKNDDPRN